MLAYIISLALIGLSLVFLTLRKVYYYLPERELKRQAKKDDQLAKGLYAVVAYQDSLKLLLWTSVGLSAALGLALFSQTAPFWLAAVVLAAWIWFGFGWLPHLQVNRASARLCLKLTPSVARLLGRIYPLTNKLSRLWRRRYPLSQHTGIYESQDLLDLVERQKNQPDNRMSKLELGLLTQALQLSDRSAKNIFTPRNKIRKVIATDTVGPMLLDELHKSGLSYFPVHETKAKSAPIVGSLSLSNIGLKSVGQVSDFMNTELFYAREDDTLTKLLQTFCSTRSQMLLITNSFEEYLGVITLEQILNFLLAEAPIKDQHTSSDKASYAKSHDKPAATEANPEQAKAAENQKRC